MAIFGNIFVARYLFVWRVFKTQINIFSKQDHRRADHVLTMRVADVLWTIGLISGLIIGLIMLLMPFKSGVIKRGIRVGDSCHAAGFGSSARAGCCDFNSSSGRGCGCSTCGYSKQLICIPKADKGSCSIWHLQL